jgi:hypothetical protein
MGRLILLVVAGKTKISERPAERKVGSDLRIGQARVGFDRAMREGNEHQRQCAKH